MKSDVFLDASVTSLFRVTTVLIAWENRRIFRLLLCGATVMKVALDAR